jgi:uncharacterized integral membrane protein
MMRYLSAALIVLFTVTVVIFVTQNLEVVTVSFLSLRLTLRLALLVILVYVVGMFTGTLLWALLRRAVRHASTPAQRQQDTP